MNLNLTWKTRKGTEKAVYMVAASQLDAQGLNGRDIQALKCRVDNADLDVYDRLGRQACDCCRSDVLDALRGGAESRAQAVSPNLKACRPGRIVGDDLDRIGLESIGVKRDLVPGPYHGERQVLQSSALVQWQLLSTQSSRLSHEAIKVDQRHARAFSLPAPAPDFKWTGPFRHLRPRVRAGLSWRQAQPILQPWTFGARW